ncbi:hypothetical protein BDY19DRAFT_402505 [Irpex rosettiformis]|uniref:Uncharacterized protein n=1 Tax=Irpex rosettiformis TaxID=378272 RepID=A0ACB8UF92_9APHY|nr:hypothetical protein BDY19DRAFT_402505 [Irpex rosettiformis]
MPPTATQLTFTTTPCDLVGMAVNAGFALVPTGAVSPPSDHIVAIAVGVGVPGGLILVTILVFIVVIFLNIRRLRYRRLHIDRNGNTKYDRDSACSQIHSQSRPSSLQPTTSRDYYLPRPFTLHTPNHSFSSTNPPSYHSTEEGEENPASVGGPDDPAVETQPPPTTTVLSYSPNVSKFLPSPAPSATTFSDSMTLSTA